VVQRLGSKFLISVLGIYKALNLPTFSAKLSKWFYDAHIGWKRFLSTIQTIQQHIFHSHLSESKHKASDPSGSVLPYPCITMVVVLALLLCRAQSTRQYVGMERLGSENVAVQLLRVVMVGASDTVLDIEIMLEQNWMPSWPLPPKHGPDLFLGGTAGGMVGMKELVGPSSGGAAEDARRRTCRLMPSRRGVVNLDRCCKLSDLFISCCPVATVRPLYMQVALGVTSHIDGLLESSVANDLIDGSSLRHASM
jgi:hypothetical protein